MNGHLNKNQQKVLEEGKHIVTVTDISDGISENKFTPYFELKLENESGYLNQRFYNNEYGRTLIKTLFKKFYLEPETEDSKNLMTTFEELYMRKISLEVFVNENGYKETRRWEEGPPLIRNSIANLINPFIYNPIFSPNPSVKLR